MSYGYGVAAGIMMNEAAGAASQVSSLSARVRDLEEKLRERDREITRLKKELIEANGNFTTAIDSLVYNGKKSDAGSYLYQGMLKACENLPVESRNNFLREVMDFSKSRILDIDRRYQEMGLHEGKSIREIMKESAIYKTIEI